MVCEQCGGELKRNAKFCGKCGAAVTMEKSASVVKNVQQAFQQERAKEEVTYMQESGYQKVFVEPDEQLQGSLGNGYLENILHKKVKKCHALLTDKRVYLQGTFFSGSGKSLQEDLMEKTVDLEDITGTGFRYSKPLGLLSVLLTYIVPLIAGAVWGWETGWKMGWGREGGAVNGAVGGFVLATLITLVRYLKNRKTDFIIEYAGGFIRFDAMIIGLSNVRDFQKQIRRAKDKAKGKI